MAKENLEEIRHNIWVVRTQSGFRKLVKNYECNPKNLDLNQKPTKFPCTVFVTNVRVTNNPDEPDVFYCQILDNWGIINLLRALDFVPHKSRSKKKDSSESKTHTLNMPNVRI